MNDKLTNRLADSLKERDKPYEVKDSEIKGFLLRVQPTGVKTYYYSYYNQAGKRKRYKIGRHGAVSSVQARDIAIKLAGRVADNEDVQESRKKTKAEAERQKSKTLRSFLDNRYESWLTAHRKSGAGNIQSIKRQFGFLMDKPLDEITGWVIEKWRTERKKAGLKSTTINRELGCLKALLSRAVDWGVIDMHPLSRVRPLKTDNNTVVRYLNTEEEKALRSALAEREKLMREKRARFNDWLKQRHQSLVPEYPEGRYVDHLAPMVLLSINTGLRRGEVFNLRWEDVSFSNATVTVHGDTAKSGRTRHIPLNQEAIAVLKKWRQKLDPSALVFPGDNGQPLKEVKKSWGTLLDIAKIKNFRWHDMRHHFASKLVMVGVDLNTVRELLGHSTLDMTLRYAHLAPEHKAEAVSRLVQNATG